MSLRVLNRISGLVLSTRGFWKASNSEWEPSTLTTSVYQSEDSGQLSECL